MAAHACFLRFTLGIPPERSWCHMIANTINIGDFVLDRVLGLVWKVVDRDDDGTIYIERNNVRSFTQHWNLERTEAKRDSSALSGS